MIDLLNIFAAVLMDGRVPLAAAIAALAGLMRGFSGFGSALIYVPLIAAIYEPRVAAATLLLIDFVSAFPFAVRAVPRCNWREILPIAFAAIWAIPFGTMVLRFGNPTTLRWAIAILVLFVLSITVAGWRYPGRPRWWIPALVGGLSGFFGGAFQMDGPPVVIYWLSGTNVASVVRANLMVFIELSGAAMCAAYLWWGLITLDVVALAILLGLPFVLSMAIGALLFHGASERAYRWVAYLIILVAAVASLPIFDSLLR